MSSYVVIDVQLKNGNIESSEGYDSRISKGDIEQILRDQEVVYIYTTKDFKTVYVGRTGSFYRRHKEHLGEKNSPYFNFDNCYVIKSRNLNKSTSEYLERQLISLLSADFDRRKRKLINRNGGFDSTSYEDNNKIYADVLAPLWEKELKKIGIVSNKQIEKVRESVIYKYSPFKAVSEEQGEILSDILNSKYPYHAVFGESGTGKSVMFTKLAYELCKKRELKNAGSSAKIAMVTSSTLTGSIRKIVKSVDLDNLIDVLTPIKLINNGKKYNYILVDEAHKLHRHYTKGQPNGYKYLKTDQIDLDLIIKRTENLILFYDTEQRIRPINILNSDFIKFLKKHKFKEYKLTKEFRISPEDVDGTDILNGIKYALGVGNVDKKSFDKNAFKSNYFQIVDSVEDLFNSIDNKNMIDKYPNNRVIAGYAREWKSKKQAKKNKGKAYNERPYDWVLDLGNGNEIRKRWNYRFQSWLSYKNSEKEIGCIHSIQGIDLNYVGVIVGKDLTVKNGKYVVDINNYFDKVGTPLKDDKGKVNIDELTDYVLNIYYVLLTRAINGLYVYFEDKEVEKLFKSRIGL